VGFKYTDPKNKHHYQVIEKELNNSYIKVFERFTLNS